MSQSELDQLLNQLTDEDVRVRRDAAKRLGDLAQPEVIPTLAHTYEHDEDEGVRRAAADSLRKYRRLERSQNGTGGGSGTVLRLVRTLLVLVLVVTVVANVALAAPRLFVAFTPPTPTQSVPTDRQALVDGLSSRLTAVRGMAVLLQNGFRGLQGMGAQALIVNKPICDQLKANEVNQVTMSDLDKLTYPDLPEINDLINLAALQATGLRGNYLLICDTKLSASDLSAQLDKLGGAAKMVSDADGITNQFLNDANNRLQNAKDHPAPTVGPTFTPIPTETLTPLPPTATRPATSTPFGATAAPVSASPNAPAQGTQAAPSGATGAAAALGVTATITLAPSATPVGTIKFDGFRLDQMTSFKYTLSMQADGTFLNGKKFSSSTQLSVMQQNTPLQVQYDIYGTNVGIGKSTPSPLSNDSLAGSTTIVVDNNTIFISGDMVRSISSQAARCISMPLTGNDKVISSLNLLDFPSIAAVPLTVAPLKPGEDVVNGVKVKHFSANQTQGAESAVIDLYVTDDDQMIPVKFVVSLTTTGAGDGGTSTPSPYQNLVTSIEYNLVARNQPVSVTKPTGCTAVPVPPTARPTAKPRATATTKK